MKIVIAGAGEVGTHLAKMLSHEQHDIIIMDEKEKHLAFARSGLEVLPIVGNPTSPNDLQEANIKNADLFISVTPEESKNITACILASNLGAQKTLARINNYEYLLPKNKDLFESIGVCSMIYPEMLAAKEIVASVKRPWTRQFWELLGGELLLIGVKVRENATMIVHRKLEELAEGNNQKQYHVVAIKRDNEMIIPRGTDEIRPDDLVFISTTREFIDNVRIITGKENPEVKNIIIMGGGRIAVRTCQYLPDNIQIKIIEADREKSIRLAETLPKNVMVINGDAHDLDLLLQEGIRRSQAFIALTENAGTNILSCLAAKRFGVYKTVAQVENLDYIPMAASLDIGLVINKKLIAASHIYQFLLEADVSNVKCMTFADANVAELVARPDSLITKKKVKDLSFPKDMTLGGLIRENLPLMVEGNTQIQAGDHVMVLCLDTAMHKLKKYFS
ncbi:MAG: Trk system potassium transporter TrkA [Tannerella sp.]|jgi:trk system potassium uptake protein TrkA|nr:Trk system potassium transporter TrkA [Tannerella sp.]